MSFRFTAADIAFFATSDFAQIRGEIAEEIIKYGDSPRLQTGLRKRYPQIPPARLAAAIEQTALGSLIGRKTGLPPGAIGSRELLEQASSAATARYHALLFPPESRVLECCAGLGADTAALAGNAERVTAVEADPVHAAILRHNIAAAGLENVDIIEGDAADILLRSGSDYTGIFADPSRRADGRRTLAPEEYAPPLSLFLTMPGSIPTVIKAAPATVLAAERPRTYIGAAGECKEQLVFLHFPAPPPLVADADTGTSWTPRQTPRPDVREWKYIIEPHNAVIASGAVREYIHEQGCTTIDDAIAYGVCSVLPAPSPLHTAFRILRQVPFTMKALQQAVTDLGFNRSTEIKKRGFPMQPEEVYKKLKLADQGVRGTIILTRAGNEHIAFLGERL